ncbi:MAG: PAS domain S-box protein, partial [Acidobacteriota bacterium]
SMSHELLAWTLAHSRPLLANSSSEVSALGFPWPALSGIERLLSAPAMAGAEQVGHIAVVNSERAFTERDLDLVKRMGALYAIAIQRARAEHELNKHRNHLEELVRKRTADLIRTNDQLHTEIAERKRTEEKLRRRQSEMATLVNSLPGHVFFKDVEGVYIMANVHFCRSLGLSEQEVIGKTDFDIYPDNLAVKYRRDDERVMRTGSMVYIGEEDTVREGKRVSVATRKVPLRDEHGGTVGLIGLAFDISELKEAVETLQESEEKYRQLFNNEHNAILLYDAKTLRVLDTNDAAVKLYGFGKEAWLKMNVSDIGLKRPSAAEPPPVQEHVKENGVHFPVEVSTGAFTWKGRQVVCAIVVDLTQRKKMEEELLRAKKLEATGILAGGIAHDFNNLLSAILGNISMALEDLPT